MFNFQGSEVIIILLLALVVLGPEKLPDAMRKLGRFYGDLKRMSSGFQDEFRSAIDEPMREFRDTANTIRDSVDFRKLQDGERDEKPKSAEMAPAEPTPTTDVPFRGPEPADGPVDELGGDAPDRATDTPPATATDTPPATGTDGATDRDGAAPVDRSAPTPHPPPPPPFSSSQVSSAAAPAPKPDTDGSGPTATSADDPGATPLAPQIAVDDEHGLREARPAEDGAA